MYEEGYSYILFVIHRLFYFFIYVQLFFFLIMFFVCFLSFFLFLNLFFCYLPKSSSSSLHKLQHNQLDYDFFDFLNHFCFDSLGLLLFVCLFYRMFLVVPYVSKNRKALTLNKLVRRSFIVNLRVLDWKLSR